MRTPIGGWTSEGRLPRPNRHSGRGHGGSSARRLTSGPRGEEARLSPPLLETRAREGSSPPPPSSPSPKCLTTPYPDPRRPGFRGGDTGEAPSDPRSGSGGRHPRAGSVGPRPLPPRAVPRGPSLLVLWAPGRRRRGRRARPINLPRRDRVATDGSEPASHLGRGDGVLARARKQAAAGGGQRAAGTSRGAAARPRAKATTTSRRNATTAGLHPRRAQAAGSNPRAGGAGARGTLKALVPLSLRHATGRAAGA